VTASPQWTTNYPITLVTQHSKHPCDHCLSEKLLLSVWRHNIEPVTTFLQHACLPLKTALSLTTLMRTNKRRRDCYVVKLNQ